MTVLDDRVYDQRDLGTPAVESETIVTVHIDCVPVQVPEGTSVMRAAALSGTAVPKLCATDHLDAFGSCRLCLVEIDGKPGTPASCTTPCSEGIVRPYPDPAAGQAPQGRHGVVHLRPSTRLPDLPR
jgi:Uncharacterized anaerobic dehydrogenase